MELTKEQIEAAAKLLWGYLNPYFEWPDGAGESGQYRYRKIICELAPHLQYAQPAPADRDALVEQIESLIEQHVGAYGSQSQLACWRSVLARRMLAVAEPVIASQERARCVEVMAGR